MPAPGTYSPPGRWPLTWLRAAPLATDNRRPGYGHLHPGGPAAA
jgi:hypothetical protein